MVKTCGIVQGCLLILVLVLSLWRCKSAQILAVLPSVWRSHYLFGYHLMEQMAIQKNYSVTIISPFKGGVGYPVDRRPAHFRLREIQVDGLLENWSEMGLTFNIDEMHEKSVMEHFTRLMYATTSNTDALLQSQQVRDLLQSPQQFDLLVVDLFLSDALLGLSFFYHIPTVVISPSGSNTWLNQRFGNPQNAALDPSSFLTYTKHMNLWQRCVNTLMAMFEKLTYSFFHMISQQAVYMKHFEPLCQLASWCQELPPHAELTENLSLALINTHPVLQYPRAFLPNMLTVAGAHLRDSTEMPQLPSYLCEFMNDAPSGVIYMSFGANVHKFPQDKLKRILEVFETLPEMRFLIKYDVDNEGAGDAINAGPRAIVKNWWPQQALLAHENVKLFITSGGFMSATEAINSHTRMLIIPITPEQIVLAENLKSQGVAVVLDYNDLSYERLLYAINSTLHNVNMLESLATTKMHLLRDVFGVKPIDRALNAIEMTLTTNGLNMLKAHTHHLNFWRSILIDVVLILLCGFLAALAVPFLVTSCILKRSHQNHVNLTLLNNQIRYQRQVNDFMTNCSTLKQGRTAGRGENTAGKSLRRSSSNSDLQHRRKRLSSLCSNSSSCFYCSSVSSSAPGTPLARDSPTFRGRSDEASK